MGLALYHFSDGNFFHRWEWTFKEKKNVQIETKKFYPTKDARDTSFWTTKERYPVGQKMYLWTFKCFTFFNRFWNHHTSSLNRLSSFHLRGSDCRQKDARKLEQNFFEVEYRQCPERKFFERMLARGKIGIDNWKRDQTRSFKILENNERWGKKVGKLGASTVLFNEGKKKNRKKHLSCTPAANFEKFENFLNNEQVRDRVRSRKLAVGTNDAVFEGVDGRGGRGRSGPRLAVAGKRVVTVEAAARVARSLRRKARTALVAARRMSAARAHLPTPYTKHFF